MSKRPSKMGKARRPRPLQPTACPCGGGAYASCCGPLHAGDAVAQTPEQLMRSRYSAYAVQDAAYLYRTLHSAHDDRAGRDEASFVAALCASFGQLRYTGLRVLDTRSPPADAQDAAGQVLFFAGVSQHRRDRSFVELSSFAREDGQWRYLDGVTRPLSELGHAPGEMTIDHWDCAHHH